jgi:hypothetical protein
MMNGVVTAEWRMEFEAILSRVSRNPAPRKVVGCLLIYGNYKLICSN